jgi:hypothetical protein
MVAWENGLLAILVYAIADFYGREQRKTRLSCYNKKRTSTQMIWLGKDGASC